MLLKWKLSYLRYLPIYHCTTVLLDLLWSSIFFRENVVNKAVFIVKDCYKYNQLFSTMFECLDHKVLLSNNRFSLSSQNMKNFDIPTGNDYSFFFTIV